MFARRVTLPWILRFAELPSRADVLEVGSGGGFTAEALLERFPDWRLVATDYDPGMIEHAATRLARFGERVRVERADAAALPYPDRSFDLVISILVWHHVGTWERATAEAARVLRPGGRLLLVDAALPRFLGPLGRPFRAAGAYTFDELRTALGTAGFARMRTSGGVLWYRVLAETPGRGGPAARNPAGRHGSRS